MYVMSPTQKSVMSMAITSRVVYYRSNGAWKENCKVLLLPNQQRSAASGAISAKKPLLDPATLAASAIVEGPAGSSAPWGNCSWDASESYDAFQQDDSPERWMLDSGHQQQMSGQNQQVKPTLPTAAYHHTVLGPAEPKKKKMHIVTPPADDQQAGSPDASDQDIMLPATLLGNDGGEEKIDDILRQLSGSVSAAVAAAAAATEQHELLMAQQKAQQAQVIALLKREEQQKATSVTSLCKEDQQISFPCQPAVPALSLTEPSVPQMQHSYDQDELSGPTEQLSHQTALAAVLEVSKVAWPGTTDTIARPDHANALTNMGNIDIVHAHLATDKVQAQQPCDRSSQMAPLIGNHQPDNAGPPNTWLSAWTSSDETAMPFKPTNNIGYTVVNGTEHGSADVNTPFNTQFSVDTRTLMNTGLASHDSGNTYLKSFPLHTTPPYCNSGPNATLSSGLAGLPSEAVYPAAEATNAEVMADRELFTNTLKRIHDALGSKFRVPVVGGHELDLWQLYKQVVAHGGLAAVVHHKKWSDVCQPFNFPSTFTSRSFTMRKLYSQILWHYEQVYMHGSTGPLLQPPAPEPTTTQTANPQGTTALQHSKKRPLDRSTSMHHTTADAVAIVNTQMPAGNDVIPVAARQPPQFTAFRLDSGGMMGIEDVSIGSSVSGTVLERFDKGFFVKLNVGGAAFQGVLYCPSTASMSSSSTPMPAGMSPGGAQYSTVHGYSVPSLTRQSTPGMMMMPRTPACFEQTWETTVPATGTCTTSEGRHHSDAIGSGCHMGPQQMYPSASHHPLGLPPSSLMKISSTHTDQYQPMQPLYSPTAPLSMRALSVNPLSHRQDAGVPMQLNSRQQGNIDRTHPHYMMGMFDRNSLSRV